MLVTQSIFPLENDVPQEFRLDGPLHQREFLVNGKLEHWAGPVHEIYSPIRVRTEEGCKPRLLGTMPLLDKTAAMSALEAAVEAYDYGRGAWPTMSVGQRIEHMKEFVHLMKARRSEVVRLIMWEIAKNQTDAAKEFDRTVDYIYETIDAMKELDRTTSRFTIEEGIIGQIRRSPIGVVLCMGPFNYPLNETYATLIPALLAGNTVVFKPPKLGVLLHRPLLEAMRDAFPKGVVNTVYGRGKAVVTPMMESGNVDLLAFIGTAAVGDEMKKYHPHPHRLRSVMGLGAKNPAIILPDADLELTVQECLLGSLSYNGQRCTALKIIFVHQSIAEPFLEKFSEAVGRLKAGMPWEPGVSITPLPEEGKPSFLREMVEEACNLGARVINPDGGYIEESFFRPAIVYPVTSSMRLYREEQFGPVIPVVPFNSISEPIEYMVRSRYGQQAAVFSTSPELLAQAIDPLINQVSRVNINTQCQRGPDSFPFTGRKGSAEGTLSVGDALKAFSVHTLVAARQTELSKQLITRIVRERRSNFLSTDFLL